MSIGGRAHYIEVEPPFKGSFMYYDMGIPRLSIRQPQQARAAIRGESRGVWSYGVDIWDVYHRVIRVSEVYPLFIED